MALILEARGEGQLQFQPYRAEQRPTLPRNLDGLEELEHVSLFDVVEVLHANAALESFAHRADVVAEAFEGGYVALVDHGAVAHHANAVVAEDLPARNVAAGDDPDVRNPEGLTHLGRTGLALLYLRGEHTAHG